MKVRLIFFFLAFASNPAHAQFQETNEGVVKSTYLILRGGVSLSKNNSAQNNSTRLIYHPGWSGGIGFEFPLWRKINFLAEIAYTGRGFQEKGTSVTGTITRIFVVTEKLNYLDIPLMIRRRFDNGSFKTFVNAGLFGAYCFSGSSNNQSTTTDSVDPSYRVERDVTSTIKFGSPPYPAPINTVYLTSAFDYGYIIGFGFIFFDKLIFDARYTAGSKNLHKISGPHPESKYITFAFTIGYQLTSGKLR